MRPLRWITRRTTVAALVMSSANFAACLELEPSTAVADAGNDASSPSDASPTEASLLVADAGNDTAIPVPVNGFALTLHASHVTLDPGETTDVVVEVLRGSGFADTVDVTAQGLGADLTTNPPTVTIASTSTQATITIKASATAAIPKDTTVTILGVSKRDTSATAQTDLGVRVGSVFAVDTASASHALPPWATTLVVKVWGGGGGAGGAADTPNGTAWGTAGGGGGFASARIQVDPNLPLVVTVGTGGAPGMPDSTIAPHGGGGGGYSSISQSQTTFLVVAGGGGGGAGGQGYNNSGQCYPDSFGDPGGAGGGADAKATNGTPNRSATATAPGIATPNGGASSGAALVGGAAKNPSIAGGVPGGGKGGLGINGCFIKGGGGGGGAGWFGGAGGASEWVTSVGFPAGSQSGGGGSGAIIAGANDIVQLAGSGATPAASTDPDRPPSVGVGGFRVGADATSAPGRSGAVVVRFTKP